MLLASFGYLHPVAAALIMFISSAFVLTRALGRSIIENYA
jgi:cation transport ATPase